MTNLLYLPVASQSVSRGVFLALGGGGGGGGNAGQRTFDKVTFPDFVLSASHLLRGSLTQRSHRLSLLCSGSLRAMKEALRALLWSMFSDKSPLSETLILSTWPPSHDAVTSLVEFLTKPLTREEDVSEASDQQLSVEDIESWLTISPSVGRILDVAFGMSLYHRTISSHQPPPEIVSLVGIPVKEEEEEEGGGNLDTQRVLVPLQIPHPINQGPVTSLLLSPPTLLMINSYLPAEVRGQLYPLFISRYHGQSFSTLCKGLVGSGPSLLVIRDTGGHVFGGFASVSWQFGPQFTGIYIHMPHLSSVHSFPSSPSLQATVSVSCSPYTQQWQSTQPLAITKTTCTCSRLPRPCQMDW